tara:strand:- start:25 stop:774 length:750 start_codon:yes stop_codon:yes gene_type:complete
MAKKAGLAQQIFVQGYDLSGDVSAINNASSPRGVQEITGINASGVERIMPRTDGAINYNTWFNDAALQEHVILSSLPTTDSLVLWALGGSIGDAAAMLVSKQLDYPVTKAADGSLAATIDCQGNGEPLEWGVMLTAGKITHGSATAAGSGTSFDQGAATSSGAVGMLHIMDISSGSPSFTIQDSANNSSFASIIGFSTVADGAEPKAERVSMTGTVRRYISVASTGTFSDCVFAAAIRVGTAQDDVAYT